MSINRRIQALNELELKNVVSSSASWHTDYRDTAYIYIGGLTFDLTEGDIVTIFSQFGEPVWLKLARDKETGKSRGFAWLKYEDQRSTDLAVDNLGGATVLGRLISVDHARYTKKDEEGDEEQFNIAFEDPDQGREAETHRHHHRRHKQRDEGRKRSHRKPKELEDEIERSDEDPMKAYLDNENSERDERRRSKERRRSRERRRSKEREPRRQEHDEVERTSHRHRRHRSPRS